MGHQDTKQTSMRPRLKELNDIPYVNYEAWQEFTDNDIFYVTREKKKTKAKVMETKDIPEEEKDTIVNDDVNST